MDLRIRVRCVCLSSYDISDKCSVEKIRCPNCGKLHPQSDQLIALMRIAGTIDAGDLLDKDHVKNEIIHQV